jgi:hypothetical protein
MRAIQSNLYACAIVSALAAASWGAPASASDVWSKDAVGNAHHEKSRFICPVSLSTPGGHPTRTDFASVRLQTVIEGSDAREPGDHVGCEYEGSNGPWATVEIVRLDGDGSYAARSDQTRDSIKARYPNLLKSVALQAMRPTSPTGGRTYAAAYYNVNVGNRAGSIAVVGGEVGAWMITIIQFDYDKDGSTLELSTMANWRTIATSRR